MAQDKEQAAAAGSSRPVISSAGDNGALTLWVNEGSTNEKAPHFTGYLKDGGEQIRVAGWLRPAGKSKDGKEYDPFVSLAANVRGPDGKSVSTNIGTVAAMNNYKGEPVDDKHRSRVIGNVEIEGRKIVLAGYVTDEMLAFDGMSEALGFKGALVTKTAQAAEAAPKPEASQPAKRPSRRPSPA